jgi:hypothetical protein
MSDKDHVHCVSSELRQALNMCLPSFPCPLVHFLSVAHRPTRHPTHAGRGVSCWPVRAASRTRSRCVPRTTPIRWPASECPRWRRTSGAAQPSRSSQVPVRVQVDSFIHAFTHSFIHPFTRAVIRHELLLLFFYMTQTNSQWGVRKHMEFGGNKQEVLAFLENVSFQCRLLF